jgi:4-carboxymuconolactone decarboxylase
MIHSDVREQHGPPPYADGRMVDLCASKLSRHTVRSQAMSIYRKLAASSRSQASKTRPGSGLIRPGHPPLDHKTAALLRVGASAAIESPAVCLEWSAARAMAAGATKDEIADALLAIAPVAGLGRIVSAAPEVATALGYDITAALEEPDGP